jgi:uncharacterized protein
MAAESTTDTDLAVVRNVFQSFATGDVAALGDLLHSDATWTHRNDDRFGGVHRGIEAILAYLGQSAELTAGTLRATPQTLMGDGAGRVAVLVQLSATRPDGRSIDNPQIVLVTLDGGRVRSIDQFVGDPRAVAAFWA